MATRVYTESSGTPTVTPSTWNFANQINPVTVPGGFRRNTGATMTSKTEATGTTNPINRAMGRTVIGPLAGGSISGTISAQMRGQESGTGANATLALAVKLIQPNGADRAVLLAQTASTNATATHELTTTLANMSFQNASDATAITLTTQTATAGDYLVIEWGFRSATASSLNITLSYGNNSATDLTAAGSETTANNPWWEFSANIGQAPLTVAVTDGLQVGETTTAAQPFLAPVITDTVTLFDVGGVGGPGSLAGVTYAFSNVYAVSIPATLHGKSTPDLLIQVWDNGTPAVHVRPDRLTIDGTTRDIIVSFDQPQSGIIVWSAGAGATQSQTFTSQTSVTMAGATHGFGTRALLVELYDAASPARRIRPGLLTVHPTTYAVTATFGQAQSGRLVVFDATRTGTRLNTHHTLSAQTSLTIPGSTHQHPTQNLLVEVYDASTPAIEITPNVITVAPSTYDVVVTFLQAQSGAVVIGEGFQVSGAVVQDGLSLSDTVQVAPTLPLVVSDGLSLGDSLTLRLPALPVAVSDGITLAETLVVQNPLGLLQVTDGLSVSELLTLRVPTMALAVSDGLTLSEQVTGAPVLPLAVTDGLSLSDVLTLGVSTLIVSVSDALALSDPLTIVPGLIPPSQVSVSDGLAVGESLTVVCPFAGREAFTNQTTVTISGTRHGYGTADLLVQVYGTGAQAPRLIPASITVASGSSDVVVRFTQPTSGYVVLTSRIPAAVGQNFTSQTSVTMAGSTHGFGTSTLLVEVYDNASPRTRILPGSVTIDQSTYTVQVQFDTAQSGRVVVGLGTSTSGTTHTATAITAQTSVTIPRATHGHLTTDLFTQVYDTSSPAAQVEPGSVTIDGGTGALVLTFRQPQSGRVVVSGAPITTALSVAVSDGLALGDAVTISAGLLVPQQVSVSDGLTLGDTLTVVCPFVGREAFTNQTTVTIPGTRHGYGTADLLVQAYGTGAQAPRLIPGSITIHPTTYDVQVSFRQPTSGYVVVTSRLPAAVGQDFTSATTVTMAGATHGFNTSTLLVEVYDNGSPRARLLPGSVTIDQSTYAVSVTFDTAQSGRMVVNLGTSTSGTLHTGVAITAQTSVTIPRSTHGHLTTDLMAQVYDASSPAAQVEPGSVTIDAGTGNLVVTFRQPQSGRIVVSGAPVTNVRSVAVSDGLTLSDSTTVLLPVLVLNVADGLLVGEQVTVAVPFLSVPVADGLTLSDLSTLIVSPLSLSVTDGLLLGDVPSVIRAVQGVWQVSVQDSLSLSDSPTLLIPQLVLTVQDGLALSDTVTIAVSASVVQVQDALTVGEALTLRVPTLPLSVTDGLSLSDSTTVQVPFVALSVTDALQVGEQITIAVPFISLAVSDGLTLADVPTLVEPQLFLSVTDALVLGDLPNVIRAVQGVWQASVQDTLTLGDSVTLLVPRLLLSVTDGLTLSETTTLSVSASLVTVQDGLTLAEVLTLREPVLLLSVTDGVAVSDVVTIAAGLVTPAQVQVTDGLLLSDSPTLTGLVIPVAVSDGLNLGDSPALLVPTLAVSASDGLAVGDLPTIIRGVEGVWQLSVQDGLAVSDLLAIVEPRLPLVVSDGLLVSEALALVPSLTLTVADGLALGDSVTVQTPFVAISVSDGLLLQDVPTAFITRLFVSVSDGLSLGDVPTVIRAIEGIWQVSVQDTLTLGDPFDIRIPRLPLPVQDALALSDSLTVVEPWLPLLVQDSLTLGDPFTALMANWPVAVSSSLTVSDIAFVMRGIEGNWQASTTDSLSLVDTAVVAVPLAPQVTDVLALSDAVTLTGTLTAIVSDSMAVGDSPALRQGDLALVVSDGLQLDDVATLRLLRLWVSVTDGLVLDDQPTVLRNIEGVWQTAVSESLALGDAATVVLPWVWLFTSEALILADTPVVLVPFLAPLVEDGVTLGEEVQASQQTGLLLLEALGLEDTVTVSLLLQPSVSDTLYVTDLLLSTGTLFVQRVEPLVVRESLALRLRRVAAGLQAVDEALTMSQAVAATLTLSEGLASTVAMSERISEGLGVSQGFEEGLIFSEPEEEVLI